jgi:hypothetical protein
MTNEILEFGQVGEKIFGPDFVPMQIARYCKESPGNPNRRSIS